MAKTPRRTAEQSHLGDMPESWGHRPVARPEEGTGRANDVMALLRSGAIVIGGTALLAWLLYSVLG
jgi:hypothetical protein